MEAISKVGDVGQCEEEIIVFRPPNTSCLLGTHHGRAVIEKGEFFLVTRVEKTEPFAFPRRRHVRTTSNQT